MTDSASHSDALRVLHIVGIMNCGGAETRLVELLNHIDRDSIHFDFCALLDGQGYYEPQIVSLGGKVLHCPLGKNVFSFFWRFYRILKQNNYDVVHSHVLLFSGICLMIARLAGVKKRIAHLRSTSDGKKLAYHRHLYQWFAKLLLRWSATKIIGISAHVLTAWFGKTWRSKSKFKVIYNGLNTVPFHCKRNSDWLKSEFNVPNDHKIILHVGRFSLPKNHVKIVSIAESYLAEDSKACFLLVGEGKLKIAIEDSVKSKGMAENFRFAGIRSDVPRIMKSADVFLFPSSWEGLGGVVVEAVAAGLPMVVSDLPAIREIFSICGDGIISPVDTSDAEWAGALLKSAKIPHQGQWLESLENSAFSISNAWHNLKEIYDE